MDTLEGKTLSLTLSPPHTLNILHNASSSTNIYRYERRMAKVTNTKLPNNAVGARQAEATLSELKGNRNVWYKIHVLIYDLYNIKNDRSSESRIERTVDELYISEPYFTTQEAALIKGTLLEYMSTKEVDSATKTFKTVDEAIKERLSKFYDKRRASGDFRPCGPHDLVPIYLSVFDIQRGELEDQRFLGRLRRSGLDDSREQDKGAGNTDKKRKGNKGR